MKTLSKLFLFEGIADDTLKQLLASMDPVCETYRRGDVLCEPTSFRKALVVLLRGECDVRQGTDESCVTMNTLRAGDSFGVASLFSRQTTFPTTVIARKETVVAVLTRADVERMMAACPQISMNLITFLTDRVEFLNRKAASLAEPTVERKLVGYLLSERSRTGVDAIPMNRKRTAEALNCGRASLYRTLEALTNKGLIACEGALIHIINPEGMERILR